MTSRAGRRNTQLKSLPGELATAPRSQPPRSQSKNRLQRQTFTESRSLMTTSLSDAVHQIERALLGSILLDNSVWPQTETLTVDDFSLDSHRRIYRQMLAID